MKNNITKYKKPAGSALILVVVVTVLLAVVGVMFLMVSRASELETSAVTQSKDLDAAVDVVVDRINTVLVEDLFGMTRPNVNSSYSLDNTLADSVVLPLYDQLNIYSDEHRDEPTHYKPATPTGTLQDVINAGLDGAFDDTTNYDDVWMPGQLDDYWLASLEPVWFDAGPDGLTGTVANMLDDTYAWPHITDLWGTIQGADSSLFYQRYDSTDHNKFFQNNTVSKIWIDPDDITSATDIWYGWNNAVKWARWEVSAENVRATIIQPNDRSATVAVNVNRTRSFPNPWQSAGATVVSLFGARADADGDGVADSRWVQIPGLMTSRGEPVFAAVRIIDNCAMLNLNGAHCFYQEPYTTGVPFFDDGAGDAASPFGKPWFIDTLEYANFVMDFNGPGFDTAKEHLYHKNHSTGSGRYLTEINYLPFLRGNDLSGAFFGGTPGDNWYDLMTAREMFDTLNTLPYPPYECDLMFRQISHLTGGLQFFDIGDELELRNRYLLSSYSEARVEQKDALNFTLDSGGADYIALRVPVNGTNFNFWKERLERANFDNWSGSLNPVVTTPIPYKYDRRPMCTVYSYDRVFRRGSYTQLNLDIQNYANANWAAAGFSNAVQYEQFLRNQWIKIAVPLGPVTTDISISWLNTASGRWEFNRNNTETRRRILHLLFALRDHFLAQNATFTVRDAAISAAQVVANLIDFSDDDAVVPTSSDRQGPFYDDGTGGTINYGSQQNVDCTFITQAIIDDMITEVSAAYGITLPTALDFGLTGTDIIFGYEKQPFISEIYAEWDGSTGSVDTALQGFAIELVNPYSTDIFIDGWKLRVGDGSRVDHDIPGTGSTWYVPIYDTTAQTHGRLVIESNSNVFIEPGGMLAYPAVTDLEELDTAWNNNENLQIQLLRPAPANSGVSYILVDEISSENVRSILGYSDPLGNAGDNALKRDDQDWKFTQAVYEIQRDFDSNYTDTLGQNNGVNLTLEEFQIGVADDSHTSLRWHDLEVLSLYGNGAENDPNAAITTKLAELNPGMDTFHFNLETGSSALLDYINTVNRPDFGSVSGRININSAPVQVIASAIPPSLADPAAADPGTAVTFPLSALQLAQQIVSGRPYDSIDELLTKVPRMKQYFTAGTFATDNVGMQSIQDDIEEEHWVFSNLANKFTVRSDTFTAYILVRLGEDGPQRRMIAIFDRSQVWNQDDRPELVALHPVPDPR